MGASEPRAVRHLLSRLDVPFGRHQPGLDPDLVYHVSDKDASRESPWLLLAALVLHVHLLSPMLAWGLGRRRLLRAGALALPVADAYRVAPRLRISWL